MRWSSSPGERWSSSWSSVVAPSRGRADHGHQGADRRERPDQCRVGVAHFDAAVALWCPVGGPDEAVQRVAAVEVAGVGDIGVVVGGAVDVGPLHFRVAHMLEDGECAVGGVRARRPAVDRDDVLDRPVVPEGEVCGTTLFTRT